MAITLIQTPANVLKAGQDIIYVASSTNVLETGFRYFVQVYEGADKLYEGYHVPNPSDYLIFNLRQIAVSLVESDDSAVTSSSVHGALAASLRSFKKGTNINKFIQVRIGEVYEVTGTLTEFPDLQNQDIHIFDGWNKPSDGYGSLLVTSDFGAGKKGWATDRLITTKSAPDHITVTGTYGEIYIGASDEDWGTIGFYNNKNTSPGINTLTDQIHYEIFNQAGTSLDSHTITLNSTTASGLPTSTDAQDKVIYMDVYPSNVSSPNHAVSSGAASPPYYPVWDYYVFTPQTSGGITTGTKLIIFKEAANCKHKRWLLGFQNSFGTYDYLPFTGRAEYDLKRKSKKFTKALGDYSGTTFDYGGHGRQTAEYNPRGEKFIKISNFFTEGEFILLQSAMISKDVVLIEAGSYLDPINIIPVTIETGSLKVHEELESKMKDVELNLKVAQTYALS